MGDRREVLFSERVWDVCVCARRSRPEMRVPASPIRMEKGGRPKTRALTARKHLCKEEEVGGPL